MPLIAWSRRPQSGAFVARAAAAAQGSGNRESGHGRALDGPQQQLAGQHSTVSELFDPRVAAWMSDTGTADKGLEFEALCVSWLKDSAVPAGETCKWHTFSIVAACLVDLGSNQQLSGTVFGSFFVSAEVVNDVVEFVVPRFIQKEPKSGEAGMARYRR